MSFLVAMPSTLRMPPNVPDLSDLAISKYIEHFSIVGVV